MPAATADLLTIVLLALSALFTAMTARKLADGVGLLCLPRLLRELLECDLCTSWWSTVVTAAPLVLIGVLPLERGLLLTVPAAAGLTFSLVRWTLKPQGPQEPPVLD